MTKKMETEYYASLLLSARTIGEIARIKKETGNHYQEIIEAARVRAENLKFHHFMVEKEET